MEQIINFYKHNLGFNDFYKLILNNIKINPNEYIQNSNFLEGLNSCSKPLAEKIIKVADIGDYRIDVPVWFGNIQEARNRIIVFGLEPRDTNSDFNIEKTGNKVFAAPFGIDRWNEFSTIKRKPQNKYFRVFKDLINEKYNFVLFSDIVKDYQKISGTNNNGSNDLNARNVFFSKAEKELKNLKEEIQNINPTHIITLGKDSYIFLSRFYPKITIRVRHPANGGEAEAKRMLKEMKLTSP